MKGGNKKMDEQATLFTDNPEYDAFVDKFGGDALCDTLANLKNYRARLAEDFGL